MAICFSPAAAISSPRWAICSPRWWPLDLPTRESGQRLHLLADGRLGDAVAAVWRSSIGRPAVPLRGLRGSRRICGHERPCPRRHRHASPDAAGVMRCHRRHDSPDVRVPAAAHARGKLNLTAREILAREHRSDRPVTHRNRPVPAGRRADAAAVRSVRGSVSLSPSPWQDAELWLSRRSPSAVGAAGTGVKAVKDQESGRRGCPRDRRPECRRITL